MQIIIRSAATSLRPKVGAQSVVNMNLMYIVAIVVLITNGAYCYIPRDADSDYSSMPQIIPMPIERQPYEINDRPVYDPGAGK